MRTSTKFGKEFPEALKALDAAQALPQALLNIDREIKYSAKDRKLELQTERANLLKMTEARAIVDFLSLLEKAEKCPHCSLPV